MGADARNDDALELEQLRIALVSRADIDQAKGVLMAAYSLAPDDAWNVLVNVSQHTNTKLHAVAEEIVASTQEGLVDGHLRKEIETALKDLKTP